MDTVDILTHVINTLTANRGALNSEVFSDRTISKVTFGGDVQNTNVISGGHGVHTAGTIGAEGDNGIGITGVAQDVRIMPLRVCSRFAAGEDSRCPNSSIVAAINYAGEKGARVANISLVSTAFSQAEVNALAANPNVLFVISAGNDGVCDC